MYKKIIKWIKKEIVLTIALVLAVLSSFFVKPSRQYIDYIDWRVLGILLSLMIVMAGLQKNGLFQKIGTALLRKTENTRQLECVLVFLCFFTSMLITNDVALITFVPFAILTLEMCGQESRIMMVVILQTIAANLGSMLTPMGNPQNLYLYGKMGGELAEFLKIMLPYTIAAFVLILITLLLRKKEQIKLYMEDGQTGSVSEEYQNEQNDNKANGLKAGKNIIYILLFFLCLAVVVKAAEYQHVLLFIVAVVFLFDKKVLLKVDYSLLFTFTGFFIFIGNMQRIVWIKELLQQLVAGKEFLAAVITSQFVSNVPAALLLSGFTEQYKPLLIGVNIGGLGTLIASMASLISYKYYANAYEKKTGQYVLKFTLVNVIFLIVLGGMVVIF